MGKGRLLLRSYGAPVGIRRIREYDMRGLGSHGRPPRYTAAMEMPPRSPLQAEVLPNGSVLCLDIDGVCAPLGQNSRFNIFGPHPGFVVKPPRIDVPVHPAMPIWLKELDRAFTHVVWISTWNVRCAGFASKFGADFAVNWPYLPNIEPQPHNALSWRTRR